MSIDNYSPGRALNLFKNYPAGDWKERAIISVVRSSVRDTLTEFSAIETIERRDAVGVELENRLRTALASETSLKEDWLKPDDEAWNDL